MLDLAFAIIRKPLGHAMERARRGLISVAKLGSLTAASTTVLDLSRSGGLYDCVEWVQGLRVKRRMNSQAILVESGVVATLPP